MMRVRKILTILLTLAMVITLLPVTAFAAKNTATTMRLAKTKGTVTVTNASGKTVTQTDNMKLYSGFKLKTGAKSYAWISLDDEKAVRLDVNSAVEVQKQGKSLVLYLSSGNLFFNVKDPLKSDESFMVRTSTMTTGIRGTSGCVRVIGPRVTEIHLLTGELEVFVEHPGLDIHDYKVLKAGQKARSMIAEYSMAEVGRQAAIVIEKLGAHEVCGICAEEISRSIALQNRMILEGGFTIEDVERIVADHDERLEHGEAVADAKQAVIDQKVDEQVFPEDVDPYFEEEKAESSGGGGSSSGGGSAAPPAEDEPETPPVEDEPETPPADSGELKKEVDTEQALLDALDEYNALAGTMKIILTRDITMDADALNELMMERNGGKSELIIDLNGKNLALAAPIENYGDLTITGGGSVTVAGQDNANTVLPVIDNYGELTISGGTIEAADNSEYGAVYNTGTVNMTGGTINVGAIAVGIDNESGGTVNMSGGTINVNEEYSAGILNADGTVNVTGGTINVVGNDSYGISTQLVSPYALGDEEVVVNQVTFSQATMNVSGDHSGGIYGFEQILIDQAVFNVEADDAFGVQTDGTGDLKNCTFTVSGYNSIGVVAYIELQELAETGEVSISVSLDGCTFTVSGTDAAGIKLYSDGVVAFAVNGTGVDMVSTSTFTVTDGYAMDVYDGSLGIGDVFDDGQYASNDDVALIAALQINATYPGEPFFIPQA